jgi:hypothetical protein
MTQTMPTDKVRTVLRELSQLMLTTQGTGHGEGSGRLRGRVPAPPQRVEEQAVRGHGLARPDR